MKTQDFYKASNNKGKEITILSLLEVNMMERVIRRDCKTSLHCVNDHTCTLNSAVSKPLEQINNDNNVQEIQELKLSLLFFSSSTTKNVLISKPKKFSKHAMINNNNKM